MVVVVFGLIFFFLNLDFFLSVLKYKIVCDFVYKYKIWVYFNIINIMYVNNLIYVLYYLIVIVLNYLLFIKFVVNY